MGNNREQGIAHFHKNRIQDEAHTQRDKSVLEALSCQSFTLIRPEIVRKLAPGCNSLRAYFCWVETERMCS